MALTMLLLCTMAMLPYCIGLTKLEVPAEMSKYPVVALTLA